MTNVIALPVPAAERRALHWADAALCAQTDPEEFFPEKGQPTRPAKRICARCDVRTECLEAALANNEQYGIWGGMSTIERHRLKQQRFAANEIAA